jgi:hypothetical protein
MTEEEIELMKQEQQKEKKNGFARWGWFGIVDKLAGSDVTKYKEVEKQNFIMCLNALSYWKERDAIQKTINKIK